MAKHIVLVHGAWQGSWSFALLTPYLEQLGWQVHALDLPENGCFVAPDLEQISTSNRQQPDQIQSELRKLTHYSADLQGYSTYVCDYIEKLGESVVLLGHSGGGLTISQVAEMIPEKIECLIYLVGMLLPSGSTFLEFIQRCEKTFPQMSFQGIAPYLRFEDGKSMVSAEGAQKIFLQDCPTELAKHLIAQLKAQPETGRDLRPILTAQRFAQVKKIYVEALKDQSLDIRMQRLMYQLQPVDAVITMDTGHVPQAIQPELLAQRLNDQLQKIEMERKSQPDLTL